MKSCVIATRRPGRAVGRGAEASRSMEAGVTGASFLLSCAAVSEGRHSSFLGRRDRPRVLYLIEQAEYSGAELGQLPVMRADVDPLLACPPGSPTAALAAANGIPTVALGHRRIRRSGGRRELLLGIARMVAGARELRRVLRAHPDRRLVYCLTARGALLASLATLGLRRR